MSILLEKENVLEALDENQGNETRKNNLSSSISCILEKKICRFDDVGDFLESFDDDQKAIVHEPFSVIPKSRRIPHHKANDWQYILDQRSKLPEDGSATALMDYNTMLLPLYSNVKSSSSSSDEEKKSPSYNNKLQSNLDPVLLDHLTGRYHPYFSDAEADRVKYLSISRISNLHSCKPKFKFYFGTLAQDFLGLSLLDENLNRIEGTEIAINVDKWLLGNMTAIFHDMHIVAVRTTLENQLKDQLFFFPSGHIGTYALPIDIRRVPPSSQQSKFDDIPWKTKLKGQIVTPEQNNQFGDGMQVRFIDDSRQFEKLRTYRRGDTFFDKRGVDRGKNFHIFDSSNGQTYMELWPHGGQPGSPGDSHVTVPINFFASTFEPNSQIDLFPGREKMYIKGRRYEFRFKGVQESNIPTPTRSFKNDAPRHERPRMKFRGTSPIIDFELEGQPVKLGIAHTVSMEMTGTTDKRVYLSHFYAFLPHPPFEIVALSGHFCFNHMHENDIGYSSQWISKRPVHNRTAPIMVDKQKYRCPVITFANGMNEMIGYDNKNVIITYGVSLVSSIVYVLCTSVYLMYSLQISKLYHSNAFFLVNIFYQGQRLLLEIHHCSKKKD